MNTLKTIFDRRKNDLIKYIFDDCILTTTRNAAAVLKELTLNVLLEKSLDYFESVSEMNKKIRDSLPTQYILGDKLHMDSKGYHFKGIDNFVNNYYKNLKRVPPNNRFGQARMSKSQTEELIERFRPLLFSYYEVFRTNLNYFLRENAPDLSIAIYAFTKIVHFNLNSKEIESFFKNLPYDRFVITRMGGDGKLKATFKNRLSDYEVTEELKNMNIENPNIRSFFKIIQRKFPDDSNLKTVALIGAPGHMDVLREEHDCTSWRLSEVFQVLDSGKGFEESFFSTKNQMEKTEDPKEMTRKTFLVRIDGEPHIFHII
jgi:hypothetical protein